jgi:type IV secretory pathway VirD2 relaxase
LEGANRSSIAPHEAKKSRNMTELFSSLANAASRALNEDELRGRFGFIRGGKTGRATSGALGARLTRALKGRKLSAGVSREGALRPLSSDNRQRVVAKVSFRKHAPGAGGGGGKLLAHAAYLERDGAAREGERGCFYDRTDDELIEVRDRLREWAVEDKRHFRLMLAPESGARLIGEDGDLMSFTREVMARMERDLGVQLDWVAVDHHNTDNPHAHVILRGVRRDGVELVLPREYVAHGLREAARDVATERLGERSIADERLRLEREVEGRGFNRLDRAIEQELTEKREVLLQSLGRERDAAFANAMKARAQELARIGLAAEVRRNVLRFERDWKERLEASKALDVRRELARGRLYEPRMGRVAGKVMELGPRGENPDRAVLVIETPEQGRLVLNTSMERIADLQRGSWVALAPEGKRAEVERLSFHGLDAQVRVRAETELDRELDRQARGEARRLPDCPEVIEALSARAQVLEANGLGARSPSGKFYFRDGAREYLRRTEVEREGDNRARGGERDLAREGETWRVREVKELFAGKAAVLERGREVLVHPPGRGSDIKAGDEVAFKAIEARSPAREPAKLELVKSPVRGLDLGR